MQIYQVKEKSDGVREGFKNIIEYIIQNIIENISKEMIQ